MVTRAEVASAVSKHVETHSSVLLFLGDRVYKFRKAVDLGFLDFRELAARRIAGEAEVALNRRLSPDVYVDAANIVGPSGELESVVVMRRMPDERRLSTMMDRADSSAISEDIRRLARLLAAFHARCDRSDEITATGSPQRLSDLWRDNLAVMRRFSPAVLDPHGLDRISRMSTRYIAGRYRLLRHRQELGFIRDGHGDLLADDIFLLPDGPRVLDCLDFDANLRFGDVLNDVAFLAMDMERLGHRDIARLFLDTYAEFSDEHHPRSLEDHYIAYRASVRCKVTCLRLAQGDQGSAGLAQDLAELCLRRLVRSEVRLVLIGGPPGTGKTTVAEAIAAADDERLWTLLRSDVIRKELAGLAPQVSAAASYGTGLYSPELRHRTYDELFRRAETALEMGESVLLDASFSEEQQRKAARDLAARTNTELVEIECTTPPRLAMERLAARRAKGRDASDADATIYRAMLEDADPWPAARELDTSGPIGQVTATALALTGSVPPQD